MDDLGSPPALAEQVAGLFGASIDESGNPTIHYCELNRRLRKAPLIKLAVELRERVLNGRGQEKALDRGAKGLARSRINAIAEAKAEAALAAVQEMERYERMGLPWPPDAGGNDGVGGAVPAPAPQEETPPPPLPRRETLEEKSVMLLAAKQQKADRKKAMLDLVGGEDAWPENMAA